MFYDQLHGHASLSQTEDQTVEGDLRDVFNVPPHFTVLNWSFISIRLAGIDVGQQPFLTSFLFHRPIAHLDIEGLS